MTRPSARFAVLSLAAAVAPLLTGCVFFGVGPVQPRHVQGEWTFRPTVAGGAAACGMDSVQVRLRDANRVWGSFFVYGDARVAAPAGLEEARTLRHGRVQPGSGHFKLVFSDHEAPNATRQIVLEGVFDPSGGADAHFVRLLPGPECGAPVVGRRRAR